MSDYLSKVSPTAFLDDTTTKNVIVSEKGELSGICDLDEMCFGDTLHSLAITKMSLLLIEQESKSAKLNKTDEIEVEYVKFWLEARRCVLEK